MVGSQLIPVSDKKILLNNNEVCETCRCDKSLRIFNWEYFLGPTNPMLGDPAVYFPCIK